MSSSVSNSWLENLFSSFADGGMVAYHWDVAGDRLTWAGDMASILGLSKDEHPACHSQFNQLINPQNLPQRLMALHALFERPAGESSSAPGFSAHYKLRRANGLHLDVEETATLYTDPVTGAKALHGLIKILDISQLRQPSAAVVPPSVPVATRHERRGANQGRVAVTDMIAEWLAGGDRHEIHALGYLLVAGIDRLSLYNEAFGSRFADELIEKTGARFRQLVGDTAHVNRIGGDIFALFFPQGSQTEMAAVAKFLLSNFVEHPIQTSNGPICVGASIGGIAIDRNPDRDPASFLVKAESTLHTAKDMGGGCFASYSDTQNNAGEKRLLLAAGDEFLRALKSNRVRLAFQPVMDSRSSAVSFHECLIRMIDDEGKLQSAGEFFPAIEKLGMSRLVDQYAMRLAIQELSVFPDLVLSVNVSQVTLMNQDWLRFLVAALRDKPGVAQRLIIEITESAISQDSARTSRIVNTLRDLGCRIALDDFGVGYTAFSQLRDLDLDIVKIDKSFIRDGQPADNQIFLRALSALAQGINIETVGEGAETMDEVNMLTVDGIDHIQGYFYGFPRVERVWLPKDHNFRSIISADARSFETTKDAHELVMEDIRSWGRG